MAAFFRGFLLFLFGALIGAAGILFFTPSFQVVVHRGAPIEKAAEKPVELAVAPAAKPAEPAAPAQPAVVAAAKPAAPVVEAAPSAEPTLDFKSISEHLVLWPNTVTVKTATTVPVMVDGKKVQDLALEAGTVLQVSKVLADGSLEARAKGAKFEIKSTLTDFAAELGKRVAELVAKGTKFDSPYPSASAAPSMAPAAPAQPATAAAATPAAATPTVAVAAAPRSWSSLTLAQRVDTLFGNNKPDAPAVPSTTSAAPAAPAATAPAAAAPAATAPAAAAPVAEVAPAAAAPTADPKNVEKGKDLDRKMNQLFK